MESPDRDNAGKPTFEDLTILDYLTVATLVAIHTNKKVEDVLQWGIVDTIANIGDNLLADLARLRGQQHGKIFTGRQNIMRTETVNVRR